MTSNFIDSPTTPLLEDFSEKEEENEGRWSKIIDMKEAKIQFFFAVPMIVTNVSYYSVTLISVMFAGHLGELELAGATLANSWAMVTGIALMTGLSGALETLCGQGYGARLFRKLGIYLQSAIITSFIFSIIVSILWFCSESVLIWLHQDTKISKMATLYVRSLIPGLFPYGFIQCILRFLQTQTAVLPLVLCSTVPVVFHVGITYVLVHLTPLGFEGAPMAASITLWISFFLLAVYVKFSEKFKCSWEGLSFESFHNMLPYMKLAIPSALMICLEYWAFEILVLLAGLMPNSESSTSLIAMCVNTQAIAFMVPFGFSAVVSTRVSNELGAGNPSGAKKAVTVTLKFAVILSLVIVLALIFGHGIWASAFSNSSEINKEFASMTFLLAFSILLDSVQGILSGVARGCGWQHLAAWTNLATFYIIGMPIAILLAFKFGLYIKGLWIGLICGLFCQACTLLVITLRTKWSNIDLALNIDKSTIVMV